MNSVKFLVALVGVFWMTIVGGAAVWWWDRRPPATPSFKVAGIRLWTAPDSLAAQLTVYKAAEAKAQARTVVVVQRQGQVNAAIAAGQAVTQAHIRTVTRTLIREVHTYVTPKADARCAVPSGFVRMHDAAAAGVQLPTVPDSAAPAPDAASGVELSSVAATIDGNYGKCLGWRSSLIGWQDWYHAQQHAAEAK